MTTATCDACHRTVEYEPPTTTFHVGFGNMAMMKPPPGPADGWVKIAHHNTGSVDTFCPECKPEAVG